MPLAHRRHERSRRYFRSCGSLLFLFAVFKIYFGQQDKSHDELQNLLAQKHAKIFAVELFHGTSNRLRAYASAAALARKMERSLVVVWNADVHAQYLFSDLFTNVQGILVEDGRDVLQKLRSSKSGVDIYDYMKPLEKGATVYNTEKHIYVRSAYVINGASEIKEALINHELQKLRPVKFIQDLVDEKVNWLGTKPFIGAHIRMLSNLHEDIPGIMELLNSDPSGLDVMNPAVKYREKCHVEYFIPHLYNALQNDTSAVIYVASDSYDSIIRLVEEFGEHKVFYSVEVQNAKCTSSDSKERRRVLCTRLAIVDFVLLSRAKFLLTSDWSSASEYIVRLGSPSHQSGCLVKI